MSVPNAEDNKLPPEEFFQKFGFYKTTFVERKVSARELAERASAAGRLRLSPQAGLAKWRQPLHWTVPPAYAQPGRVYELLRHTLGESEGHEAFCQAVEDYYSQIGQAHLSEARRVHTKWVIRQVLRTFETQVRGFRRQDVSKRTTSNTGGGVFAVSSPIPTQPEDLIRDGRWSSENIQGALAAYGVPVEERLETEKVIREKLTLQWGVRA